MSFGAKVPSPAPLAALLAGVLAISNNASAAPSASHSVDIDATRLFSDQGPMFDSNPEPTAAQSVTVRLRAKHGCLTGANIKYRDSADGSLHVVPMSLSVTGSGRSTDPGAFDYWEGTIPASGSEKRYRFQAIAGDHSVWLNAAGVSAAEPSSGDFFVIPGFKTPGWMKNGVFYQIFVDRFYDGDPANDPSNGQYRYAGCAVERHPWGARVYAKDSRCNSEVFFGGDLAGIDQKLGYIKQTLGASILYLTPIFRSPSNHKYDTADYYTVDPAFGSGKDLVKLIQDVHSGANGPRGFIILDGVFNHSGDTSCWFDRSTYGGHECPVRGAYQSRSSPYYGWYTFQRWPDAYSSFFGYSGMPKLDYGASGSPVRRQIYGSPESVVQTYLRAPYDIDGWRLDSAQLMDAAGGGGSDAVNHQLMRELRVAVKSIDSDAEILGEYWGDASPWLNTGREWDSAMNYNGFTRPLSEWLCGYDENGRPASLDETQLDSRLRLTRAELPVGVQEVMTNELSTHDTMRFTTRCGGDLAKTELGLIVQFTYVGTPGIYYGDEYGMHGGKDPDDRRTFDWSQASTANAAEALTRKLIALRKRYPALRTGSFITLIADDSEHIYSFGRFDARNRIAVVLNNDGVGHTLSVPAWQLGIPNGGKMTDQLAGITHTVAAGSITVRVAARSGVILAQ